MDHEQAVQLGKLLRDRREELGLSTRRLAEISGVNHPTIIRIERGDFATPGPDKLKALAKALDLNLADLWNVAGYGSDTDLPSPVRYLRAKYRDLPEATVQALSRDVEAALKRHGIEPTSGPAPGEDEAPDIAEKPHRTRSKK
jgi:transcriptional regulator with XRE-family HTH domain